MEITTKGITAAKNQFNKSNGYYYQSPKITTPRLFKEVSMHYLCKKYFECVF